jgi:ABC-type sugar transport system ATPase subunit
VSTRADLIEVHRRLGTTMVLVTHDQAEALALGDRVAVLDQGKLVQLGTAREVYDRPATSFVAGFIGSPPMSLLPCRFDRDQRMLHFEAPGQLMCSVPRDADWASVLDRIEVSAVTMGVRADHIKVLAPGAEPVHGVCELNLPVRRCEPTGADTLVTLAVGERDLSARLPNDGVPAIGQVLRVCLDPRRANWFDASTGKRID